MTVGVYVPVQCMRKKRETERAGEDGCLSCFALTVLRKSRESE